MTIRMSVVLAAMWFAAVVPSPVSAQDTSRQQALSEQLEVGQKVTLIGVDGRRNSGVVEEVTGTTIVLGGDARGRRPFALTSLRAVRVRDPLKNGALIGFGVGAVMTYTTLPDAFECECEMLSLVGAALVGGVGAIIGAGLDGLVRREIKVSASGGPTLTVAPSLGLGRRGVRVVVTF